MTPQWCSSRGRLGSPSDQRKWICTRQITNNVKKDSKPGPLGTMFGRHNCRLVRRVCRWRTRFVPTTAGGLDEFLNITEYSSCQAVLEWPTPSIRTVGPVGVGSEKRSCGRGSMPKLDPWTRRSRRFLEIYARALEQTGHRPIMNKPLCLGMSKRTSQVGWVANPIFS